MNTTIFHVGGGATTIQKFAETHNLEMEVHERGGTTGRGRYYAHFKSSHTKR